VGLLPTAGSRIQHHLGFHHGELSRHALDFVGIGQSTGDLDARQRKRLTGEPTRTSPL
jgi:hypothetical protein